MATTTTTTTRRQRPWLSTALVLLLLCLVLMATAADARSSPKGRHRSSRHHRKREAKASSKVDTNAPDPDSAETRKEAQQGHEGPKEETAPTPTTPQKASKRRRKEKAHKPTAALESTRSRGRAHHAAPAPPAKVVKKPKVHVIPHHLRAKEGSAVDAPPKVVPPSKRQYRPKAAPVVPHSPFEETYAETLCIVKIPTGSPKAAWEARNQLDRAGLGLRYDHGRFLHEIEAYIPATELTRLVDPDNSPLPGGADVTANWVVVRNVTRRESAGDGLWGSGAGTDPPTPGAPLLPINKNRYHSSSEMERVMRAMVRKWPHVASVQSLGRTMRGEVLWGLKITGHGAEERNHPGDHWKPVALFTGAMHGDDLVGREMCLWLAEYLCKTYESSSAVRSLLSRLAIFLIPDPSPDASAIAQRFTTRHIDIDRGFPERVMHRGDPAYPERETEALMQWVIHNRPIVSASFLGGGGGPGGAKTIVRYPWNGVGGEMIVHTARLQRNVYQDGMNMPTPDDRNFRHLARLYAVTHATMARNDPRVAMAPGAGGIDTAEAGIVNGGAWYPRFGSLQDWVYDHTGALHFDLLISPHLKPLPDRLSLHWDHNRRALMTFLRSVDGEGLRGTVRDAQTGEAVPDAMVIVRDNNDRNRRLHPVATDTTSGDLGGHARGGGHFARYLQPGRYAVWAEAPGYKTSKPQSFIVSQQAPIFDVDITLIAG